MSPDTVLYRGVETICAGFHTPAAVSRIPALFGFCQVCKEQHDDFSEGWTCGIRPTDRFIAKCLFDWRGVLLTFYVPESFAFVFHQCHHIVAFSVHKDYFKSHFSQGVNQVARYHTTKRRWIGLQFRIIYSSPFKEKTPHFLNIVMTRRVYPYSRVPVC